MVPSGWCAGENNRDRGLRADYDVVEKPPGATRLRVLRSALRSSR